MVPQVVRVIHQRDLVGWVIDAHAPLVMCTCGGGLSTITYTCVYLPPGPAFPRVANIDDGGVRLHIREDVSNRIQDEYAFGLHTLITLDK